MLFLKGWANDSTLEPMIVPAIIANDQTELSELLSRLKGVASRVMLDFMDGEFVSNVSLQFDYCLPEGFSYEAHLMIQRPLSYLSKLVGKIETVILHIETLDNVEQAIIAARRVGFQVMLALSPRTPIEVLAPYLGEIKGVLIVTVEPGKYGADFLPWTLEKIRLLRQMDKSVIIEADGGMNPNNARAAKKAGADVIASGSYIIRSHDVAKAIRELENAIS